MRRLLPLLAAGLALVAGAAQAAKPAGSDAELDRLLAGRVAGEPVHCIDLHRIRSSHIVPHTAIVYDAGGTVYVNRPRNGAETMDRWDTMVERLYSSQLCDTDTVQLVDHASHTFTGMVFLGDFVPYTREPGGAR
jgi:hypothetical protein